MSTNKVKTFDSTDRILYVLLSVVIDQTNIALIMPVLFKAYYSSAEYVLLKSV